MKHLEWIIAARHPGLFRERAGDFQQHIVGQVKGFLEHGAIVADKHCEWNYF